MWRETHQKYRRKNEVINMANENVTTGTETTVTTENQNVSNENKMTLEEAMEIIAQKESEIAKVTADRDKFKASTDKLSKAEAERKRAERANMSETEQKFSALEEEMNAWKERAELSEKENNHNKAVNAYKVISDEKTVEGLIDAVSDADHNAIAQIIANECKKAVAEAEAKWMKDRPRVNHGMYSSMSKDQIMAISDRSERLKAIAENQAIFN